MNGDDHHAVHQKSLVCRNKNSLFFNLNVRYSYVAFSFWECFADLDLSFLSSSNSRPLLCIQDEHIYYLRALCFFEGLSAAQHRHNFEVLRTAQDSVILWSRLLHFSRQETQFCKSNSINHSLMIKFLQP